MAKHLYLLAYNTINTLLWLYILLTTLSLSTSTSASPSLYTTLEPSTRWTQSLAIADILHAALGITRAPVQTTFTQVFTRCVQVWAIDLGYPQLFAASNINIVVYAAMLLAWSSADAIRYAYFVVLLATHAVPGWLKWLRYSLFFILYPIGIGAEWWLMMNAARVASTTVAAVYYFCLCLYVPGAIMMYSYMVKQRRKTLHGR